MVVKLIYDLLVGVPLTLCQQVLEGIRQEIDKERLITEDSIKQRLQQLQLMLQDGEISEQEYEELETRLIERLREVREFRKEAG
jgi:predicted DNA-binding protein (UPF0278 family)